MPVSREHALLPAGIISVRLKLRRDEPIPARTKHRKFFVSTTVRDFSETFGMKIRSQSFAAITFTLATFALQPIAQGVVPPPDGGYPGFNTAEGQNALFSLTTGQGNTAVGWFSLFSNTEDSFNTGVGAGTLVFNIGDQNTASGVVALLQNTTGSFNTANGALALSNNTEGDFNTATGEAALYLNTTGNGNTATGAGALTNNTSGGGNIAVGADAAVSVTTANNVICIGLPGQNVSNSCYIGQIFGATSASGIAVFINSDGKLGTSTSSRRFKEEIKPMEQASEALFALKPVTFRYKKGIDPQGIPQFGLVAEEVEAVNPDLVVRDADEKAYTVRYDQVNAMLLNEFLKEHKRVEEQQEQITALSSRIAAQEAIIAREKQEFLAMIARQDKEIRALMTTVKEQAAQIQKVSAQIQVSTAPLLAAESP
jgi:Chaperone of endosialidase